MTGRRAEPQARRPKVWRAVFLDLIAGAAGASMLAAIVFVFLGAILADVDGLQVAPTVQPQPIAMEAYR